MVKWPCTWWSGYTYLATGLQSKEAKIGTADLACADGIRQDLGVDALELGKVASVSSVSAIVDMSRMLNARDVLEA